MKFAKAVNCNERKLGQDATEYLTDHRARLCLNLGCGTKTSQLCVNIDWTYYLLISKHSLLRALASPFLTDARRQKMRQMAGDVMLHNLKRGIPFADCSVDAVYHSHLLEHLDRDVAPRFQREILRVLRPGGIQRICVPDLHEIMRRYVESYERGLVDPQYAAQHDDSLHPLLEQSVRKEAFASNSLPPVIRTLERWILGDARGRGETHQWMYDEVNLRQLLQAAGFVDVTRRSFNESRIDRWQDTGLEIDNSGNEYKRSSLYMEARKPS